jgi:DedD protein
MGLFSNKNKRDRAAEDSGRFYSKDDDAAIGERARAKRASNAGATAGGASRRPGNDPMLPEKKRARRRLVGAIALALAVAIGLPMLLDSEPKQLAGDIAIQIPSKDKAAPLPAPAAPAPVPATEDKDSAAASAPAKAPTRPKTVAAADSVDQGEEVLDAPPPMPKAPKSEVRKSESKPEHKEPKPEPKPEHRDTPKPEHKEAKAEKPERKPESVKPKLEDKPVKPHEDTRALAILEGKPVAKPAESKAEAAGGPKAMVQVAAMSSEEKAAEVQAKLRAAGIGSTTEKSANGLVRVKIGPYTRDEAEKARAKVAKLGL